MDADHAAIRTHSPGVETIAVEGPLAWADGDREARIVDESLKQFALGHQLHALWLHFEDIATDRFRTQLLLDGENRTAQAGNFPYGGTIYLIDGEAPGRPAGLRLELPKWGTVDARFDGWRTGENPNLPWLVRVSDGKRIFDYRYSRIELSTLPPGWFPEALEAPDLDAVRVYRLHRALLVAHCTGDAAAIARLSAPQVLVADRGQLSAPTRGEVLQRFKQVFQRLDYIAYYDMAPPHTVVSGSGDMGWIAANVRAVGKTNDGAEPFDTRWAWIMTVKKIDGAWLQSGNAANRPPIQAQ